MFQPFNNGYLKSAAKVGVDGWNGKKKSDSYRKNIVAFHNKT